ncbi:Fic family protein [Sphingomonas crocodyli]|uniref:Fic family protein n=1 Tax=Sphingomonas crocodyli TaxID=1979270 RepID=A0A437LXT6_9SPHN|nr:Fic family protein [Sphingomonas crocodyli]RVT90228.1 Fic family protein [Sphingomonas crocodyli]
MVWNWQHPDWPALRWDSSALAMLEAQFLLRAGVQIGSVRHFDADVHRSITIEVLTGEALKTSEIEGEILNRDSVQSSILRQFGLTTGNRRVQPTERGIANMMVDLYRHYDSPLTHDSLHGWHRMIASGRTDIKDIGTYRSHDDPMQVASGPIHKPKVHFEAPPSAEMTVQMAGFLQWFASSAPDGDKPLPPLTRAGLAHLYFVSIHPYEDGNGRISRALAVKALAQAIGQPALLALSHVIQRKRPAYYDALEANNKGVEITGWLTYFAQIVLDALDTTQVLIDFLIAKAKFYDRARGAINERQERVIERMCREGPDGFTGGLSAANYISISGAARATATRDLQDLVKKRLLTVAGALKSTRYHLALDAGY